MKYLKQFVVGSCAFVFLPFYYGVYNIIQKNPDYYKKKSETPAPSWWISKDNYYSYYQYTLTTPIFFGLGNILSLVIAEQLGLSMRNRFVLMTILSTTSTTIHVYRYDTYNFKTIKEYVKYYIGLFIGHFITWNVIIYNLEKHI
tara:strand:- start:368 stop:799 length:432 start_codon:yes stop_codon:yes gene_type:complete